MRKGNVRKIPTGRTRSFRLHNCSCLFVDTLLFFDQTVRIKVGTVVDGDGAATANMRVEQNAAYWEIKCLSGGRIGLGLVKDKTTTQRKRVETDTSSKNERDPYAFVVGETEDTVGCVCAVSEGVSPSKDEVEGPRVKVGDVLGVAFCQSDSPMLTFYVNGVSLESGTYDVKRIRGPVRPVLSVHDGASAQFVFREEGFTHRPPSDKFNELIRASSVI